MEKDAKKSGSMDEFRKTLDSKKPRKEKWSGTVNDYLELVKKDSSIHKTSSKRIWEMISREGFEKINPSLKYPESTVRWNFFRNRGMFGSEKSISDIMEVIGSAANGTKLGDRFIVLLGPTSSGKSTFVSVIKRGLEKEGPFYRLAGCPKQCEPLHIIPRHLREDYEQELHIGKLYQYADICFQCRKKLLAEFRVKETDEVEWQKFPVETYYLSERAMVGIGTFQPSDKKSQDVTSITGRVDEAERMAYGLKASDPNALDLRSGAACQSSGGVFEVQEVFRADPSILYLFGSLNEEKVLKHPEGSYPPLFCDAFIIGHINLAKYKEFKGNASNDMLHSRIRIIWWKYNLRLSEEIEIYKNFVKNTQFSNMHMAPYAYETAARMALVTRMAKGELCPDLSKRIDYYTGSVVLENEKKQVDLEEIYVEGERNEEGLRGLDYRFIADAISLAQQRSLENGCTSAVDVFKAVKEQVEKDTSMQVTLEEKKEYLLRFEEFIRPWLDKKIRIDVNTAFVSGYQDLRKKLFDTYILDAISFRGKELRKNAFGKKQEFNEDRMRVIEDLVGISQAAAEDFRRTILEQRGIVGESNFTLDMVPKLGKAIDQKICDDVRELADHAVGDTALQDSDTVKRRNDALGVLIKHKGYCEKKCADGALRRYRELLDEDG